MTNDELLHKWINGTLSEEELREFQQRPEYESLVILYKNTEHLQAPAFEGETMLTAILKEEKQAVLPEPKAKVISFSTWGKIGIAASVLIIVGVLLWMNTGKTVVYEIARGQQQTGVLPDQSTFVLNAESKLRFNQGDWPDKRSLELEGEAYFEVQKGSDFIVTTPNGSVQVLGTRFNVRARNAVLEVSCQEGKVAVLSADGKPMAELNPRDAIRLVPGKEPETWQTQPAEKADWTEGISRFRKVALASVIDELERQFDVEIKPGAVNISVIVSCNFQHTDLELALKTTLDPLEIQYNIEDKKVIYLSTP